MESLCMRNSFSVVELKPRSLNVGPGLTSLINKVSASQNILSSSFPVTQAFPPSTCHLQRPCTLWWRATSQYGSSHMLGFPWLPRTRRFSPHHRVVHTFLLFPTIERMSESPNGKFATPFLCRFRYMLYAAGYLIFKPCPEMIKSFLVQKVLEKMSFKSELRLTDLLQPFCLAYVLLW